MDKRPSSAKTRRTCFETNKLTDADGRIYMVCHLCGNKIDPARDRWEAEHVIRRVLTKDDSASNLKPAHYKCHKPKTAEDISANAKGKRVSDKHFGIERKRGWR